MKKIVIIGPESTGKSSLAKELAEYYNCSWVPEYAREYLLQHGMNYSFEDLLIIARGQLALEEKFSGTNASAEIIKDTLSQPSAVHLADQFIFMDTDMYVMKVWCEFVFGKCHNWILDQVAKRKYDLYLLCNTDLPWVKDELREYPDPVSRQKLYQIYKDIMINQSAPWIEISGGYDQRLSKAKDGIQKYLS